VVTEVAFSHRGMIEPAGVAVILERTTTFFRTDQHRRLYAGPLHKRNQRLEGVESTRRSIKIKYAVAE
jgi:hypothetical protein